MVKASGPDGTTPPRDGFVNLLDCDTISQAKGKLYRAIYPHQPYSQRPHLDTLNLLWTPANSANSGASLELSDTDEQVLYRWEGVVNECACGSGVTSMNLRGCWFNLDSHTLNPFQMSDSTSDRRTFNTLATYKVKNNDTLALTMFNNYHPAPMSTIRSVKRRTTTEDCRSVRGGEWGSHNLKLGTYKSRQ